MYVSNEYDFSLFCFHFGNTKERSEIIINLLVGTDCKKALKNKTKISITSHQFVSKTFIFVMIFQCSSRQAGNVTNERYFVNMLVEFRSM